MSRNGKALNASWKVLKGVSKLGLTLRVGRHNVAELLSACLPKPYECMQVCNNNLGQRNLQIRLLLTAVYILSCNLAASLFAAEQNLNFIVRGTLIHEVFGPKPFRIKYSFVARNGDTNWAVSCFEEPRVAFNKITGVGNDQGVFITMEPNPDALVKNSAGNVIKKGADINLQAMVFKSPVPNTALAEAIGPIWLTFLSSHFFQTVTTNMIPPPTELNIAGGCVIPPFQAYQLRSSWELDKVTGLPRRFYSMDDGQIRRLLRGEIVTSGRYPEPYNEGFTNLVFNVIESTDFLGRQLPKAASLEVFWIFDSKLERIHRFFIESQSITRAPDSPIPEPSINGIAAVADERVSSSNGPIRVQYMATNRFLTENEIQQLPSAAFILEGVFEKGVTPSISKRRFAIMAVLIVVTFGAAAKFFLLNGQKPNKKTKAK
jgi:hypothetical protein